LQCDASGVIWVGQLCVTLEIVVCAYETGSTAEEMALAFDAITLAQICDVITCNTQENSKPYFADQPTSHRQRIDRQRG